MSSPASRAPRKFLVVVDKTPEHKVALRFATRRAQHTNGRVTLMDKNNQIIEHLGDSHEADNQFPLRNQTRDKFVPGEFICPHGACFDHAGNIFVVEWVDVGRVTKLRKVA